MPSFLTSVNSTNVRDYPRANPWPAEGDEDTAAVVALALLAWMLVASTASLSGVVATFSVTELAAIGLFATVFAWAAYRFDERVRAFVQASGRRSLLRAALAIDATVAIVAARWLASGTGLDAIAAFPFALAPFVLVPLAVVVHAAQLDGLRVWRAKAIARGARNVRSAVAKGPARSPAATSGSRTSAPGSGAARAQGGG
jgi:hypothetical protein